MKDSLKINDSLEFMNGSLVHKSHNTRIIGEINIQEIDPLGNVVFSSTEHNDLTIGGATFILEQMFKRLTSGMEFNLSEDGVDVGSSRTVNNVGKEKIFGFMIGVGGEDGASVKAPNFVSTKLDKFVPFRVVDTGSSISDYDPNVDESMYLLPLQISGYSTNYTGYYVKKFTKRTDSQYSDVKIIPEYVDGSGEVTVDNIGTIASPIYTYAELILDIDQNDVRRWFNITEGTTARCQINQLGLVAGRPVDDNDTSFDHIKLVTIANFKGRDLSNNENTLKLRYKIYCM